MRSFIAFLALVLAACGGFGHVNQGQVVAYDKAAGLVTLISDSNYKEPGKPRFDVLPPVTVRVPEDRREMGPEPRTGRLLRIDSAARQITFFEPDAARLATVPYTPIEEQEGVYPDDPRVKERALPIIDRARKTITAYAPAQRKLATFSIAGEHLSLPEETWRAGDEIRYYYKDPARALRLMNITRTDLNKAGK